MRKYLAGSVAGFMTLSGLAACGGGGGYGDILPPPLVNVSYVGPTGVFAATADPDTGRYSAAVIGSYAGKRQVERGSIDFLTGMELQQPAGAEIYKGSDGHIHAIDLTSSNNPSPQQLSTENAATVDDTCSLSGTAVSGANYDYVGVYFTADLQNPVDSTYFYRLPGADGTCNSIDDVFHMVKTGMSPTDAPIAVSAMPLATVRTSSGGISGFVVKSGADLVLVDANFANPVILGTFAAPIGVAAALAVGTVQGYPVGQLYVVDGNIVYVNYVAHTLSAVLFSIPNWTPTNTAALFAASPSTLYFSITIPGNATTPATASLYAMPSDGSAIPALVDSETGRIAELQYPAQSSDLVFSVENSTYAIRTLPAQGGAASTLTTITANAGSFTATATNVYYTTWTSSSNSASAVVTHSGTQSGIVAMNGSVVQPLLANSSFMTGGEQFAWPNDTVTTQTPYETMFQITGLSPVTVIDSTTGIQYIEDGVSGGILTSIDTTSNRLVATLGQLPISTATFLSGTFRGYGDTGFIEATNAISTQDPATRDLYLINSHSSNTLLRVTDNL